MTRRQLLRLLAAAPALAVTGCTAQSASSQQEKPLILRYAENQPEDYPTSKAAKAFAELVAQRTDGRVKVLVYSGAELGAEQSVIQQMQFGGVDFSRVSLSQLAEYEPELSVLQLPYLYSEFMKAALENTSYFRPLAFDYPDDPDAREVEDQLLLGEGLMAAPVYVQNAHGRHVYLPEPMKLLRLRAVDDYDEEILPAGHHYIRCALDEVLLFLRPGHIVPVAQPANNTSELDDASLTLWSFLPDGESAEYRMYRDDGVTTEYEKKEHWKTLQIHHS